MGEAVVGAVLLGAITSLAGVVTSLTAAYQGYADLAISNAIGGIAVQTLFLAFADMTYKKSKSRTCICLFVKPDVQHLTDRIIDPFAPDVSDA